MELSQCDKAIMPNKIAVKKPSNNKKKTDSYLDN